MQGIERVYRKNPANPELRILESAGTREHYVRYGRDVRNDRDGASWTGCTYRTMAMGTRRLRWVWRGWWVLVRNGAGRAKSMGGASGALDLEGVRYETSSDRAQGAKNVGSAISEVYGGIVAKTESACWLRGNCEKCKTRMHRRHGRMKFVMSVECACLDLGIWRFRSAEARGPGGSMALSLGSGEGQMRGDVLSRRLECTETKRVNAQTAKCVDVVKRETVRVWSCGGVVVQRLSGLYSQRCTSLKRVWRRQTESRRRRCAEFRHDIDLSERRCRWRKKVRRDSSDTRKWG